MLIKPIHPADRTPHLISQLTQLWRQSVDASHHFLTPAEITAIEQEVPTALRTVPQLLIAMNEQNEPTGFIGIDGSLIAMLFITPLLVALVLELPYCKLVFRIMVPQRLR